MGAGQSAYVFFWAISHITDFMLFVFSKNSLIYIEY